MLHRYCQECNEFVISLLRNRIETLLKCLAKEQRKKGKRSHFITRKYILQFGLFRISVT